jgi:Spy/CpxP family protein refolding chaperone
MFTERLVKFAIITAPLAASIAWQAAAQAQQDQPYAGLQSREIKALSSEEIADLRGGRGMGVALAAELNGYPGPRHVLDLAGQLNLTDDQRTRIQQLFDSMKAEAVPVGQKLIAAERDLNRAFVERTITPELLKAATAAIGEIQGKLRDTHLKYHLATAALLSPDQIQHYADLGGYRTAAGTPGTPASPANSAMPHGGAMGEAMHQHMMGTTHGQ